jgi:hypothetical protein
MNSLANGRVALGVAVVLAAAVGGAVWGADGAASAPATQASKPPLVYNAISDTKYYAKPELPKLEAAGFVFKDPTFGCPMVRVSDEKTYNGDPILTPAGSVQNTWNTDSTLFIVQSNGGRAIPYQFDPKTLKIARIPGLDTLPNIAGDAPFSYHEKDICFGKDIGRNVLVKFNFTTQKATDVCDVTQVTGLPVVGGHLGMFSVSANDILCVCFGGAGQNRDMYCLAYDMKNNTHHIWDTKEMKIDGKPIEGAVTMTMHACEIDPSGRYVIVTPGQGSKVRWVWDTQKATVNSLTTTAGGHAVLGFGDMVNDDHQFYIRTLDPEGIKTPKPIMSHPAGEPYFAYDSHTSWNNAREGILVPVVASSEHVNEMTDPKCAYGDEIIAVATDGSQKIWRFCHTRALVHMPTRDAASGQKAMPADRTNMAAAQPYNFWDTQRGNVSQDGKFFMFNSNWGDSVGKDRSGRFREDVFIVKLERDGATISPAESK